LIVEDEIRREHWKLHLIDEDLDLREHVLKKHNFDHIPMEKRIRVYEVEKDEQVIETLKEKIELAKEYYEMLMKVL
jgi:hypothetical protein